MWAEPPRAGPGGGGRDFRRRALGGGEELFGGGVWAVGQGLGAEPDVRQGGVAVRRGSRGRRPGAAGVARCCDSPGVPVPAQYGLLLLPARCPACPLPVPRSCPSDAH